MRKFALTAHVVCSVGWIGAVIAYLALGVAAETSREVETVRAAYIAMEVTYPALVSLAVGALSTGLVMSFGTRWGLLRHYWTLFALVLTTFATAVLLLHAPAVSRMADTARGADGADLARFGGDFFHAGVGLAVLLAITVLNVYKPRGMTRYGRRAAKARSTRRTLA